MRTCAESEESVLTVVMCTEHVPQRTVQSCSSKSIPRSRSSFSNTIVAVQPAGELLDSARDGLREGNFHHVEPETLCALALAASGGMESLETWCEDIAEARLGVCQVRSQVVVCSTNMIT